MTEEKEKKSSDLSSRLGVKRPKPGSLNKLSKSTSSTVHAPPKAAVVTLKPKKDDIHRRRNPFNDMIHSKSSKDKDRDKAQSEVLHDEEGTDAAQDVDGWTREGAAARIAELERVLAAAREAQDDLKDELSRVKEHGVRFRDTANDSDWQLAGCCSHAQKRQPAVQILPRAVSPDSRCPASTNPDDDINSHPRHSFDHHHDDIAEADHDLHGRKQSQNQPISPSRRRQSLRIRDEAEWEELTMRLHAAEKDAQERLQQLLSLKSSISALTRAKPQITDVEIAETFVQLSNRVREWVVSNLRRAKMDFSGLPHDTEQVLTTITPEYARTHASDRLALYQALVASALMAIFREPVLVGLPVSGPLASIRQIAAWFDGTGSAFGEWRRSTLRCLQESSAKELIHEERKEIVHHWAGEIVHHLLALTSVKVSPLAQASLEGILHETVNFQNTLLLQNATYKFSCFNHPGGLHYRFDDIRMESINEVDAKMDEDDDVIVDRVVAFCVFPCLEKFGNEQGEHDELQNVLKKASVCCRND